MEDEEEEVYETVNVYKLKQYLPNLRIVNLWGVSLQLLVSCSFSMFDLLKVPFITDEHVEALSSNCAYLECLCVNYCEKVIVQLCA